MDDCPATLRIVLVNEPRVYRETIAATLRLLYPQDEVLIGEPAELGRWAAERYPHVVICSAPDERALAPVRGWIVLYPGGSGGAIVSVAGRRRALGELDFAQLLDVVEATRATLPVTSEIGAFGGS